MKILQLVDSENYVKSNCYQHQLHKSLASQSEHQVTLCEILNYQNVDVMEYDGVISTLKMRTLHKFNAEIKKLMRSEHLVVYDQDPWESYRVNGACVGAYETIAKQTPVSFVVTTPWWVDYLQTKGHDVSLVNMGVLPEYCNSKPKISLRSINIGFIGSLHPHREKFLKKIKRQVNITQGASKPYSEFLDILSTYKIYARSDDMMMKLVDGTITNMNYGMFAKDIEIAARGGFSIRDHSDGIDIACKDIQTIRTYKTPEEANDIIEEILTLDKSTLDQMSSDAVELIRSRDYWSTAAQQLISKCSR